MKKRFSEEQIIGFLKEADAGVPVKDLCRRHGFSDASFYNWRTKFGGMDISDAKRLKALESAGKRECAAEAVAGGSHARQRGAEGGPAGKILSPQAERGAVSVMQSATTISERRACCLLGLSRTVLHYEPLQQPENALIRDRLVQLAEARRRFGYRRLHALLRREGVEANHKRVHRIYRDAGLAVRRRRKRHGVAVDREPLEVPTAPNQVWSMDFVFDALASGRRIKCLTVVDDYTRESIDVVADQAIGGAYVTRILDRIATFRGYPAAIRTDQGPEFTGRALDQWAYRHGVQLKLIQAGKPTQNAFIESFNGRFRDECFNDHWFTSLHHARQLIAEWRRDYNEQRPHSSLGYRTPAECAAEHRKGASPTTTIIEQ